MQVCNMIAAIFVEFQIEKHGSLTDELKNMASFFLKKKLFQEICSWDMGERRVASARTAVAVNGRVIRDAYWNWIRDFNLLCALYYRV